MQTAFTLTSAPWVSLCAAEEGEDGLVASMVRLQEDLRCEQQRCDALESEAMDLRVRVAALERANQVGAGRLQLGDWGELQTVKPCSCLCHPEWKSDNSGQTSFMSAAVHQPASQPGTGLAYYPCHLAPLPLLTLQAQHVALLSCIEEAERARMQQDAFDCSRLENLSLAGSPRSALVDWLHRHRSECTDDTDYDSNSHSSASCTTPSEGNSRRRRGRSVTAEHPGSPSVLLVSKKALGPLPQLHQQQRQQQRLRQEGQGEAVTPTLSF